MNKVAIGALAAIAISGCAVSEITPMDKGTYWVHKRTPQIGFGPANGARADVYAEANRFCSERNADVETVNLEMVDSGFGRPASAGLQFRCINKP